MTIKKLHCKRCDYSWYPRDIKKPKTCASVKCRSPYWYLPIVRHSVSEARKRG